MIFYFTFHTYCMYPKYHSIFLIIMYFVMNCFLTIEFNHAFLPKWKNPFFSYGSVVKESNS